MSAYGKSSVGEGHVESAAERAARAGWGLSAASIHWGKRGAASKPVAITERDRRLLELLHDVNYLFSSQMALLGWSGDSSAARRRLRLLHDHGLIDKFRPAAPAGSFEWNYRLTLEGAQPSRKIGRRRLYIRQQIEALLLGRDELS